MWIEPCSSLVRSSVRSLLPIRPMVSDLSPLASGTSTPVASGVLSVLRAHVLEQSVQCLLMRGDTVRAGIQLQEAVDTCHSHPMLVYSHRAVLHTLLV